MAHRFLARYSITYPLPSPALFFCILTFVQLFPCRLINLFILFRREVDKVNSDGVFFLWCYITRQPVNLPMVLAVQLRSRGGNTRRTSPILGTHLITALARSYQIPLGSLQGTSTEPVYLRAHYLQNSRIVHQVNGRWVIGLPPPVPEDSSDDDAADDAVDDAAAPPPPPPHRGGRRGRAARGPPAPAPEMPPPPPHPPVDQLAAYFDRMDARFDTIEHQIDVNQQWNAGMFLGLYEQQGLQPPAGYQYPYTYHPHPPFYRPPGPQ